MSSVATEQREKNRITLVSVAAALVMALLKLAVGLLTGSLGLISEAAHSGLDMIASVITFFSVRIAGRPADEDHPYGHGRVENLSATVQGLLLLATATWIIYESVRRIFLTHVEVESSPWAFAVMGASIIVDLWRSRMLTNAARRYHSPSMEADALNFRADMLSSVVVILGLALTAYGARTGRQDALGKADAFAALFVAFVIIFISGRLALRALNVLLDRAPATLGERMNVAAASVPGVVGSQPVRLRESGDRLFADIVVTVPRTTSLAEAHTITERVEESIRHVEPRTETVVHVEPAITETETAVDAIRAVALRMGVQTHHEQVHRVEDALEASLHVEVGPESTLGQAYESAQRLVDALQADNPQLRKVDTHIEVAAPHLSQRREVSAVYPKVVDSMKRLVEGAGVEARCHEVRLYRSDNRSGLPFEYSTDTIHQPPAPGAAEARGRHAVLHCDFPPTVPMGHIHRRTELIEQLLRERFPQLDHIVIQAEPRPEHEPSPE